MTHVTSLPLEIWLEICSYLEVHEIVKALSHLNEFFDELLHSNYLRVHLRVRKDECNWTLPSDFIENIRLESIRSITATRRSPNRAVQFLRWNWGGLTNLESLSIILRKHTVDKWILELLYALEHLRSLKTIRIRSLVRRLPSAHLHLFRSIFGRRPSLSHCQIRMPIENFEFGRFQQFGRFQLTSESTIRYLTVEHISWSNLLQILSATPHLVSLKTSVETSRSVPTSLVLPSLRKIVLRIYDVSFVVLQEIRGIAPHLDFFSIHRSFSLERDETFAHENSWKSLLDGIRSYHVEIRDLIFSSETFERYKKRFAPCIEKGWLKATAFRRCSTLDIFFQST